MKMMKFRYLTLIAAVVLGASCAKDAKEGKNDSAKTYFEAWVSQNYPGALKTGLGAYILKDEPGTGSPAGTAAYLRIAFSSFTLDGNMASSTYEHMARRTGSYKKTSYYGPTIAYRGSALDQLPVGIEEAVASMKEGGKRTVAVPGWLTGTTRYDSPEEYLEEESGTDYIYELELVEAISDIEIWEKDSLANYVSRHYPDAVEDSEIAGFWYIPSDTGTGKEIAADSTVYINYTGRRLDGTVFDTTIADTAKVWGLWSSSKTYSPVQINWNSATEDYTAITMGSDETTVVKGFAYALSKMHGMEKGTGLFWSDMGYAASGSGDAIPSYSPLIFELEMTSKP